MLNRTVIFTITVVALSLLFLSIALAGPNMREGMWEIATTMKMEGLPIPMVPMKHNQCITQKDMVPRQKDKNQDCTMISNKITGNTVTWVMRCKDKHGNATESKGKITYQGSSFDGAMDAVTTDTKGAKRSTHMQMKGKRIGDCK